MTATRKGLDPGMSYKRVVQLYLTTEDGERCPLVEVPPGAFEVLLLVAMTTIPAIADREAAAKAIKGLDYTDKAGRVDRWFAIATLKEYGAALPLFTSSQDPDHGVHHKTSRFQEVEPMSEAGCRRSGIQGIDPGEPYKLALPLSL